MSVPGLILNYKWEEIRSLDPCSVHFVSMRTIIRQRNFVTGLAGGIFKLCSATSFFSALRK
jgi:hypothetical protein